MSAKHFLGLDIDSKLNEPIKPSQLRNTWDVYTLSLLMSFETTSTKRSNCTEKEKTQKAQEEMHAQILNHKEGGGKGWKTRLSLGW